MSDIVASSGGGIELPPDDSGSIEDVIKRLFAGVNYGAYRQAKTMRQDDLLVRQRASTHLTDARSILQGRIAEWSKIVIRPATRENPFPDPEVMVRLRELEGLKARFGEVETAIRSCSAPGSDAVWNRFRSEQTTLTALIAADVALVGKALAAKDAVENITVEAMVQGDPFGDARAALTEVQNVLRDRRDFLMLNA